MYYYQHHIGDFIKDTSHLTNEQLAVYLKMIWRYYECEKPFSDSVEDIAFAMRSDEKTVQLILRHFFVQQDDGWHQTRCDREIQKFHNKSEKAAASANARWTNANAMRTHSERNANELVLDANQEPITNNQIPPNPQAGVDGSVLPAQQSEVEASFDQFWSTYPRHEGKKKALEWFQKRKPSSELLSRMLASIAVQAQSDGWRKDGGRFIPMPTTWLNGERWEDAVPSAPIPSLKVGTSEYFAFHKSKTWWREAGFGSVWEAGNEKCWHHNAHEFQNGKRGIAA